MANSHDWTQPPRPRRPLWWGDGHGTGVPYGQMRVSNVERNEVTNALVRHLADGRLDEGEFNDRIERATAAKTRDDLAPILIDLPPLDSNAVATVARRRGFPPLLLVIAGVLVAASALPFTFVAWHMRWVLVFVLVIFVLYGRRRRHHIRV